MFFVRNTGPDGPGTGEREIPLAAVLAAVLATVEQETAPPRGPGHPGMPAWKRAALWELMNTGTRDYV